MYSNISRLQTGAQQVDILVKYKYNLNFSVKVLTKTDCTICKQSNPAFRKEDSFESIVNRKNL